jgi:cytochrome c
LSGSAKPRSLTDEEVYALTAFILAKNKLIGDNDVINVETLPKVRMPYRDGLVREDLESGSVRFSRRSIV